MKEALDGGEFNVDANDEKVLQILAQHAQQARLEERERCAAYIEGRMQLAHDGFDLTGFEPHNAKCRAFATAIRKGEAA
ncbi:hypothetical protein FJY63_12065 [Candidatus Sumerlaeota bacterium]|nr:hypothetical protein [Candidatus Sumerlaeota bacterium]